MPRKKSCLYLELHVPEYVPFLTVAVGGVFLHPAASMGEAKSSHAAMSPLKTFMLSTS